MESAAEWTWPGFSIAERDRRWNDVRAHAAAAGVDCVLVPRCLDGRTFHLSLEQARGVRSDSKFITQIDDTAVVMPTDGREPIVITEHGAGNDWIPQPRAAGRAGEVAEWGTVTADALIELGMERATIGVSGLAKGKMTHGRALTGVVSYGAYAEVQRRLPNATFIDGTNIVGASRYVKSAEEIVLLTRGAHVATEGIDEMVRWARPGVEEATLYAKVMRRMLAMGSEYYPLALNSGPIDDLNYRHEDPMLGRTMGANWLLTNEVDSVFGGLVAQEMQPVVIGPIPDRYKPLIDAQREVFLAGLAYMTPGREFADLISHVTGLSERLGYKVNMLIHGRRYGDDAPIITPQDDGSSTRDVLIQEGNVFVWKPTVQTNDGATSYSWGGCVLVTEKGGAQLVNRPIEMVSVF
jgi:Xaa-Pro aminopeptidase